MKWNGSNVLLAWAFTLITSYAAVEQEHTIISIETDPSTFLFNGNLLHLRIKPGGSETFLVGAGTYNMDIPDLFW